MNGAPNPARSPVLPQGAPAQGGPRRKTLTELIFRNDLSGSNPNLNTCNLVIRTPSTRLITMLAVTFKPDDSEDISTANFPAGFFLTFDAWIRASREIGGFLMRANNIITNTLLPFGLNEPLQGIDEIRGTLTLPFPTGLPGGSCYLTATWEPAPGESSIPDRELQTLFGVCTISTTGGLTFGGSE